MEGGKLASRGISTRNKGTSRGIWGAFGGADNGAGEATNGVSRAARIIKGLRREKERTRTRSWRSLMRRRRGPSQISDERDVETGRDFKALVLAYQSMRQSWNRTAEPTTEVFPRSPFFQNRSSHLPNTGVRRSFLPPPRFSSHLASQRLFQLHHPTLQPPHPFLPPPSFPSHLASQCPLQPHCSYLVSLYADLPSRVPASSSDYHQCCRAAG